ncbi:DUF3558 domain-containing protein [Pseudonocardia hispaniensis]|uniref:DUF3558 domain-containing protein n=1 Tax=Pseudonocardia hispaniensis TaxID=904933 RepID=A0ABW1IY33_9PSEU
MRRARSAALMALLAALAGCAAPEPAAQGAPAVAAPVPASATAQPAGAAPRVAHPRDARGIAVCDLLTPAQLTALGLRPETAEPKVLGTGRLCGWRSTTVGEPAGLTIATEIDVRGLDYLYGIRDTFAVFEPLEVAGHPAVRADGNADGRCSLYVAIAEYQLLSADGNLAGRPLPDPCARSRRMIEAVLSNLPPLR